MIPKLSRLVVCSVALACLLSAGTAQAAPARLASPHVFGAVWSQLMEWIDTEWFSARGAKRPADKEGCGMDPNGRTCPASIPVDLPAEGCDMDPNGKCSVLHAGADMDPNG